MIKSRTGYTSHAGWNLVTTAKRDGSRLVGVILGGSSAKERDKKMVAMLENHFKQMQDKRVYANNQKTNKIKRLA
jgi:D-alanyl-D-alanine carboxypeptidase (penicillin-binding protein 5/6)